MIRRRGGDVLCCLLFCSITFNTTARKRHHVKLVLFYLTTDTSHFDDCQDGRSFISKLTKQKKTEKYLCCVKYTHDIHDTNKPITYSFIKCIFNRCCLFCYYTVYKYMSNDFFIIIWWIILLLDYHSLLFYFGQVVIIL